MPLGRRRERLVRGLLIREGSTRAVGLARILFALIAWIRFEPELHLYRDLSPDRVALTTVFHVALVLMIVGWQARRATGTAALCMVAMIFGYGELGGYEGWTHHHTHALAMLFVWIALTPNGRSFSLDRWLAVRRARRDGTPVPEERGDLWATRLVLIQLSAVYFWSAVHKSIPVFLSGVRLEHLFHHYYWGSDPFPFPGLLSAALMASAVFVVAFEYGMSFGLWLRSLHRYLIPLGVFVHVVMDVTLPVKSFSETMIAAYLVILDPAAVHRFVDTLLGGSDRAAPPPDPARRHAP